MSGSAKASKPEDPETSRPSDGSCRLLTFPAAMTLKTARPPSNALIEVAEGAPGFLGGKLSGAGWAGCTVNLVRSDLADEFARVVSSGYTEKTDTVPEIYVCHAADGAFGLDLVRSGP